MIVCLGWGSLIWRPENLPIVGSWHEDGPELPVEFVRQSRNGQITLVIHDGMPMSRVLWGVLDVADLDAAREAIRVREGTSRQNIAHWSRSNGQSKRSETQVIASWAAHRQDIEAVVWTALGPKFEDVDGRVPTADQVLEYLRALDDPRHKLAEVYVRNAPAQIRTPYRDAIERELQWMPLQPTGI